MQSPDDEIIPAQLPLNNNQSVLSPATTSVSAASAASTELSATVNELSINRRVTAGFYTNSPEALAALPPSAAESIREFRSTSIPSASLVAASKVTVEKLSVREDITAQVILDASKKDKEDLSKEGKSPTVVKSKNYYSAGVMVLVPEGSAPDVKTAKNKLWNEPSNNLAYFQREALEAEIVKHLFFQATAKTKSNTPSARRMLTLYGLSGTGKTLLAINTIYRPADYETRCWFDAKNTSTLKDQYANFAKEMNIVSAETPVELAYKKAKDWLKQNPRSLLIFDNAEDYKTLSEYLPNSGVDILITSLNNNWPGTLIEVPVFNLSAGEDYVKFLLESDEENISTLVNKFGGHPLALAQAAAYIKGKETVASYLKHYEIIKAKLLEDQSLPPDTEHDPVAISWHRIMQVIKQESEEALEILYVCAFLNGDNIPEKLIKAWLIDKLSFEERFEVSKEKLKANLWEQLHGFKMIYAKYSIVKINSAKKSFAMHKLLQDVVKQQMNGYQKEELLRKLLQVVCFKFARSTKDKKFFQQRQLYIPHLENLTEYCQQARLENIDYYLTCLNALGVAYIKPEDRQKKKEILFKAMTVIKNSKTANALDIAKVLMNLSFACQNLHAYEKAESFLNEALALATFAQVQTSKQSFILHREHEEYEEVMLACYINLGLVYVELNNYQKSIEVLKYALKRCKELSNSFRERAECIWKLGRLANSPLIPKGAFLIYADVGLKQNSIDKYSSVSIGGYKDKLYDFSELLLIITLTHLGNVCYQQGLKDNDYSKFLQSKAYLDKALQHHSVMGNTMHPTRAIAFMHVGKVHQQLRLFTDAEANFINSLRITKYVFGDAHLNIAGCFNNLYELYKQVEQYPLAMECSNIVLRISAHYFTEDSEEIIKIRKEKGVCQTMLSNMHLENGQPDKGVESVMLHVKKLTTLDFWDEEKVPVILPATDNVDKRLLEALLKNLSDDDADIRQSAAQTLFKLGRVNANVIKNLGNDDWSMRKSVTKILENLKELNNPRVMDAYAKNLNSHKSSVRAEALKALNRPGNSSIMFNVFINNLSSDEYIIRREASEELEKLGKSKCSEVKNAHIKNLNSDDAELRQESAEALIKLGNDIDIYNFSSRIDDALTAELIHESTVTPFEMQQAKQKALDACVKNLDLDNSRLRQRAAKVLIENILIENNALVEKVIDALIRSLGDENYIRESTELLEKLGKASDRRVVEVHINNLNSDNSLIVRCSIEALCKAGKVDQKVVDACLKNLSDKSHFIVEAAADTLLKLGKIDNNAIEILFNRLSDEDHWIRGAAKEKLIKWGKVHPLVVEFLLNKLSVCASTVKAIIAEILSCVGNTEEKVVTALFPHLDDENAAVRQCVAEALIDLNAENDQVIETFIKNAKNPSIFIRKHVLQKIGNLRKPNDRAIEALMSGLGDEDSDVREYAENALQRLKKINDLKVHDACLLNLKSKHSKIRQFGIEMVGRHKIINDQIFDELIKCLSDDFKSIRRSALETIEKLGKSADPKVIVAHISNLIHPAKEINLGSIEALGKLENVGDDVINALKKCSSSNKDYFSKVAAEEVIKKLSSRAKDQHVLIIDAAKKDGVKKALAESTEVEDASPKKIDDKNANNMQSRHAIFNDKKALGTASKIQPPLPSQEEIQHNYLNSLTKQDKDSELADEDNDLPDGIEMHDPSLHNSDNDVSNNKSQQVQRR